MSIFSAFWITSFKFVKVCGIRFSVWESFIGFYICCYPITTILACLFSVGVQISWKKLCWMRAWRWRWHLLCPTLYIIIVYRVNLNKLSQNFIGATRTTTIDSRVSFIDLYLVFPTNFRIVFLPHTNNVILLEPYSGTITEPGLPVQANNCINNYQNSLFLVSWVIQYSLEANHYENDVVAMCLANLSSFTYNLCQP